MFARIAFPVRQCPWEDRDNILQWFLSHRNHLEALPLCQLHGGTGERAHGSLHHRPQPPHRCRRRHRAGHVILQGGSPRSSPWPSPPPTPLMPSPLHPCWQRLSQDHPPCRSQSWLATQPGSTRCSRCSKMSSSAVLRGPGSRRMRTQGPGPS